MLGSKFMTFASGIAMFSTMSLAWSISGKVVDEAGAGIPDVDIASFNYAGISGKSDSVGNFFVSNDKNALATSISKNMSVNYSGKMLSIEGISARSLKISLIDALGKVTFNKDYQNVSGSLQLDLSKVVGQRTAFLRVTSNGSSSVYSMSSKGTLQKLDQTTEKMASLMFTKTGYEQYMYEMKAETETGVIIPMKAAAATTPSSSDNAQAVSSSSVKADNPQPTSSSVKAEDPQPTSSSAKVEEVVDCSNKTLKTNTTLTIDGRKVILEFPNGFDGSKPAPLLVNYHPIMGSAEGWQSGSQIAKVAKADGAIVAFMDGAQGPMGQAWNVGPCCTDADDVAFSKSFLKEMKEKACVDPKRIYAAGFSMGGGMSNYVGCFMADEFAAAAPSAFDLAKEIVDAGKCKPARPFPILNFRGTNDNIVMYDGGLSQVVSGKPITFMGAKNNLAEWAKMNGCKGSPKSGVPGNNCEMYEDCDGGVKTGLCTIQGGGHEEGNANQGWEFLKQFTLP